MRDRELGAAAGNRVLGTASVTQEPLNVLSTEPAVASPSDPHGGQETRVTPAPYRVGVGMEHIRNLSERQQTPIEAVTVAIGRAGVLHRSNLIWFHVRLRPA